MTSPYGGLIQELDIAARLAQQPDAPDAEPYDPAERSPSLERIMAYPDYDPELNELPRTPIIPVDPRVYAHREGPYYG